jgi:membrane protein
MDRRGLRTVNRPASRWIIPAALVSVRAFRRMFGRDVMLYTGGVSFFALLAVFPALAILLGIYSLLLTPEAAAMQADAFAQLLPPGAHALFQSELERLARAPMQVVSAQSGAALLVGLYAAHRGFKALIAGLSFIHDEEKPRGFFGFNILAFIALLVAFALLSVLSGLFLAVRLAAATLHLDPLKGAAWWASEWVWASLGLTLGLTLVYRYAMSSQPVAWRGALIGGAAAASLSITASWASALYVKQFANFGATYGSIAAVVVMLVWLSWNVNAVFYGGAVATELEILVTPGKTPGVRSAAKVRRARPS